MPYQQLIIITSEQHAEEISEWLTFFDALSVSFEAADQQEVFQIEPQENPLWNHVAIKALYTEQDDLNNIVTRLQQRFNEYKLHCKTEVVEDQDWVRTTQAQFQPQCYAEKLWVVPAWDNDKVDADIKVLIDPGLAFGTGNHATTSLCLEWLANHPPKDKTVIDYGCGSGILALAALALGAIQVDAVDHDEQAIEATHNNAKLNDFISDENLKAYLPHEFDNEPTDVVLANILANPLIELAPTISACVKPSGTLILSGLLTEEVERVTKHYLDKFKHIETTSKDEWARVVLQKI